MRSSRRSRRCRTKRCGRRPTEFRERIAKGETLDQLLPEAFAVVREASRRALGQRHFDVQLIGGMVLHDGKIAEMRTGEGKTLTATLAVYLNALVGKGVHVVTVNDYLVTRDADWMGRVYRFLGMTVGTVVSQQSTEDKRAAYAADITYGTNNEFGFDYLRDNMEYAVADRRQRGLAYAIVDEVDSILIDEARTPLIISGPAEDHTDTYVRMNEVPKLLTRQKDEKGDGDFWVDEKAHQVHMSESGHEKLEGILTRMGLLAEGESLYSPGNIILMHHLNAALRAHTLFHRDQQYVVQNGEVVIVDEFTGRLMAGPALVRRPAPGGRGEGEASRSRPRTRRYASITFQNYFRMYGKLAGMTGTADTEAYEFQEIYGLETVVIPTHRPMIRIDSQDQVFRTLDEKYNAILDDIKDCYARGQPVLVGTTSIENSELLSGLLKKENLPHQVLNAKQHAREAEIVAQAGRPKMITIATNMAGRGTDIVLGGNCREAGRSPRGGRRRCPEDEKDAQVDEAARRVAVAARPGGRRRRPAHHRHRAARVAPDRQPAARPLGPPGRPGRVAVLPVDGRPAAAHLRRRPHEGDHGPPEAARGRGDRGRHGHALDRERAAQGRGPQLRHPQAAARVRRRRQRPAREIYRLRNDMLETDDTAQMVTNLRHGVFTDMFRSFVPADSVEEQWDLAGPREGARRRLATARAAEGDAGPGRHDERRGPARAGPEGGRRGLRGEGLDRRARAVLELRALDHAADPRPALARAPVGAR